MALLDRIQSPKDLRALPRSELRRVVAEARHRHIDVVSEKGGHFGASLGVAELTVPFFRRSRVRALSLLRDGAAYGVRARKLLLGRIRR